MSAAPQKKDGCGVMDKYFMADGKKHSVIFTVKDKESGKQYIAYTDGSFREDGRIRMFFSVYTENEDGIVLIPASIEQQQNIIYDALMAYLYDDEWNSSDSF